jgi:hypothetical protein
MIPVVCLGLREEDRGRYLYIREEEGDKYLGSRGVWT